jgi:hypothetical protein
MEQKMTASAKWARVVAICLAALASTAAAQTWPSKTVRVIVPFAPGGGADLTARPIAQKLSENLGQQFVVDNRGGAAGAIGMELTAKAPPDGYTIISVSGSFSVAAATRKMSFDPMERAGGNDCEALAFAAVTSRDRRDTPGVRSRNLLRDPRTQRNAAGCHRTPECRGEPHSSGRQHQEDAGSAGHGAVRRQPCEVRSAG